MKLFINTHIIGFWPKRFWDFWYALLGGGHSIYSSSAEVAKASENGQKKPEIDILVKVFI